MLGDLQGATMERDRSRNKAGRYKPGYNSRRVKKERVAHRLAGLIEVYAADAATQQVLGAVAVCLDDAEHAHTLVARVRAGNAARRLLATITRKPPKPPMTIAEFERLKREGKL